MQFKDLNIGDMFTVTIQGTKVNDTYARVLTPNGSISYYIGQNRNVTKTFNDLTPFRAIVTSNGLLGIYLGNGKVLWEGQSAKTHLCEPATEEFYAYVCNR